MAPPCRYPYLSTTGMQFYRELARARRFASWCRCNAAPFRKCARVTSPPPPVRRLRALFRALSDAFTMAAESSTAYEVTLRLRRPHAPTSEGTEALPDVECRLPQGSTLARLREVIQERTGVPPLCVASRWRWSGCSRPQNASDRESLRPSLSLTRDSRAQRLIFHGAILADDAKTLPEFGACLRVERSGEPFYDAALLPSLTRRDLSGLQDGHVLHLVTRGGAAGAAAPEGALRGRL